MTARFLRAMMLFYGALTIVLQILVWIKAKRAEAKARIPISTGTPDRQDTDAVHDCLTKAGFSEPPGVSVNRTVYIRPYWGTVYVHEGGYWEHQIAYAKETLMFEGYGARTLASHLRLLELSGRPALSKG